MSGDGLSLESVSKRYGRMRALAPVSLTLGADESVALLGANGAGKSTLLALLAGLVAPTSGRIVWRVRGRETRGAELRAKLGVVAHHSMLYGELTALENLRFFASLYPARAHQDSPEALLAAVGLERSAWGRPVKHFSRGMGQRVALARALVGQPDVLLLDEPFTGLDREGIELLLAQVAAHRDRGGLTVLVSHDFAPVARTCSRVLWLHQGRLVADHRGRCTTDELESMYHRVAGPEIGARAPGDANGANSNQGSAS